jgi:hypothetical protein
MCMSQIKGIFRSVLNRRDVSGQDVEYMHRLWRLTIMPESAERFFKRVLCTCTRSIKVVFLLRQSTS